MARTPHNTEVYQDDALKREIVDAYGSLRFFAAVSAVEYACLYRVVSGKPCTQEDIRRVLDAWAEYNPEMIFARADSVADGHREGTIDDFRWIYGICIDLLSAAAKPE